jgi:hypothetical protein
LVTHDQGLCSLFWAPVRLGLKDHLDCNGRKFALKAPQRRFPLAKILEMHSGRRRSGAQASSTNGPLDLGRIGKKYFLPDNAPRRVSGGSRPGPRLQISIDAGSTLLLVVAVAWMFYLGGNYKKAAVAKLAQDQPLQTRATPQISQPSPTVSLPSPVNPVNEPRIDGSSTPKPAPNVVPHSAAFKAPRYPAMRYEATRKKVFGGCTGELELTGSRLQFRCPDQADLIFPVDAIAKAHKDGVVLKSGEKYHFTIANYTRGQVEEIFVSWLNSVQQFSQQSPD